MSTAYHLFEILKHMKIYVYFRKHAYVVKV